MKLLLADDQTPVRQGLLRLLSLASDIKVVAEAVDGWEALDLARRLDPNLLLLDVRMPGLDGLGVLRTLRAEGMKTPVVLLSTFSDESAALSGLRLGAHSYLLKDVHFDDLLSTLRAAVKGESSVHSRVPRHLAAAAGDPAYFDLTSREHEILRLMAGGYSNKQIALVVDLQEGTVKNHVSSILLKLGVHDRTRAVLKALELGLL
ncbi:response regulator [Deinococcus alpinitundrae]|uniref:response regulator n=1 Tax=Deinococcus alpinitundrae TaxID=468913 RepID=UPI00137A6D1D|nr:response regulator transcription factor [Deinococcus alpinitundrae]